MRFNLPSFWYQSSFHPLSFFLRPFASLFHIITSVRRSLYTKGLWLSKEFTVPIIIVGNITVGGTGKTPFVIWLVNFLQKKGFKPGIVSRGVGGKQNKKPHWVGPNDLPNRIGDEAKLLSQQTNCPLVIGVDRAAAVHYLLYKSHCDIVIADDGLQHYRLARDLEIAIVDGERAFGNGFLLPAGPLRERKKRLSEVDFVIINGKKSNIKLNKDEDFFSQSYEMSLEAFYLKSLTNQQTISFDSFKDRTIHAIAGIGNPDRFFKQLKQANFTIIPHSFPDHYLYQAKDLEFNDEFPIVMTEKDAVKCISFAKENWWSVPIFPNVEEKLKEKLLYKIRKLGKKICF